VPKNAKLPSQNVRCQWTFKIAKLDLRD